jgi:hypothetical protein
MKNKFWYNIKSNRGKQIKFLRILIVLMLLIVPSQSLAQILQNNQMSEQETINYNSFLAQAKTTPTLLPNRSEAIETSNRSGQQIASLTTTMTIIISTLSLIVSLVVAYYSNFRSASIKLLLGRNIVFFFVPGRSTGGVGFNIPITFYNWSPEGGTIYRIRLVIGRQNSDDYYDMAWTTFVKITSESNFADQDLAQPIPIEGRSSVNKIIRFDWSPELGGKPFDIQASKYDIIIYGWTQDAKKPDLKYKVSFSIKKNDHEKYEANIAANQSESIWVSLDENANPNQVASKDSILQLYDKQK